MSGTFTLNSASKTEYTFVSNAFIDHYMAQANGSYVKVYLYLLRLLSSDSSEATVTLIADHLEETEKDIERALKYWEKQKLIQLERDASSALTGITFLVPQKPPAPPPAPSAVENKEEAGKEAAKPPTKKAAGKGTRFEKPNYSAVQIAELTALPDVQRIAASLEQILGRLLKSADEQLILYLYESVGLSADLIIYLFEYCAAQNKKSNSYIEAVALAWAEEGIDTIEKAEASCAAYSSNYNAVNRAFGLNRVPGHIEKQYIQCWFQTWGFDIPIVEEACNRTILAVSKPDFKYANSILESWHNAGVKRKEDIAALDSEFAKKNAIKETARQPQNASATPDSSGNNRFHSFPQRKYTASDYSSMEEKLLNQN